MSFIRKRAIVYAGRGVRMDNDRNGMCVIFTTGHAAFSAVYMEMNAKGRVA